jgi:hypothetical protein
LRKRLCSREHGRRCGGGANAPDEVSAFGIHRH